MSRRIGYGNGNLAFASDKEDAPVENDPLGQNAGIENPYIPDQVAPQGTGGCPDCNTNGVATLGDTDTIRVNGQKVKFTLDGIAVPQAFAIQSIEAGTAMQCPNNACGAQVAINSRTGARTLTSSFQAYPNGTSGYNVPVWEGVNQYSADGRTLKSRGKLGIVGSMCIEAAGSSSWNLRIRAASSQSSKRALDWLLRWHLFAENTL